MDSLSRQSLHGLLDSHLANLLVEESYAVAPIAPAKLITSNRLDIAIKILYLELKILGNTALAEEIYLEHIKAFSLGSFAEPGNEEKVGAGKFLADFDSCHDSIRRSGFDSSLSIVPLAEDGSLANGSHRVASAFQCGQEVATVRLPTPTHHYDAEFFLKRGMNRELVEMAVTRFIECAENCYTALIWPSARGHDFELARSFANIIYRNEVPLDYNGAHNLISQIYYGETWLGSERDNFPGARAKLVECFKKSGPLRVVAFQADSLATVQTIKEKIRNIFGIGKHSIHISDTKEEAIRVARILFNRNSIHFLNHGKPNRFASAMDGIERFKDFLASNRLDPERALIDSSHVLALYGLRESKDIDYLSLQEVPVAADDLVHSHFGELEHHRKSLPQLICDARQYFYFEDLKFVSFDQLYRMKLNRAETKDKNDLLMMEAMIEANPWKNFLGLLRQRFYYLLARLKMLLMAALRQVGLYKGARYVYRRLIKRQDL